MQPLNLVLPVWLQGAVTFVPAISAVFAAVGLFLNVAQSRRSNRQARAALVAKFFSDIASNEDMMAIFYDIEYSRFTYDDNFAESEDERKLDELLIHFTNLALAWKSGLLEDEDIEPVGYFAKRLLRNEGVRDYLRFVEDWSSHAELGEHPFQFLKKMGDKLGV